MASVPEFETDRPCNHGDKLVKNGMDEHWHCSLCGVAMTWMSIPERNKLNDLAASFEALNGSGLLIAPEAPAAVEELPYIMTVLLPEWRKQFSQANAEYGNKDHLGPAGAFVDINRKTKKLRRALWDKIELKRESPREVAMDMIGHLFLMVYLMDMEADSND